MVLNQNEFWNCEAHVSHELSEKELSTNIHLGTAGVRGPVGIGPGYINKYTLGRFALCAVQTLANYYIDNYMIPMLRDHYHCFDEEDSRENMVGVIIGYDNRYGSEHYARHIYQLIAQRIEEVSVEICPVPTPVSSISTYTGANSVIGVYISASHCDKDMNGIKIFDVDGSYPSNETMEQIREMYLTEEDQKYYPDCACSAEYKYNNILHHENYYGLFDEVIPVSEDIKKIVKIGYSALHGTGGSIIPKVLYENGYTNLIFDSTIIQDPELCSPYVPNPENGNTIRWAMNNYPNNCTFIFYTDTDADRVNVTFLTGEEKYVIPSGQNLAAIVGIMAAKFFDKDKPLKIIKSEVTTSIIDYLPNIYGDHIEVINVPVGYKHMTGLLSKYRRENINAIAIEESCGFNLCRLGLDKDAIPAILFILQAGCYLFEHESSILEEFIKFSIENKLHHHASTTYLTISDDIPEEDIVPAIESLGLDKTDSSVYEKYYYKKDYPFLLNDGFIKIRVSGTELRKVKVYQSMVIEEGLHAAIYRSFFSDNNLDRDFTIDESAYNIYDYIFFRIKALEEIFSLTEEDLESMSAEADKVKDLLDQASKDIQEQVSAKIEE